MDDIPEDWVIIDRAAGLSASPRGTIYQRPATSPEDEQELNAKWEAYMATNTEYPESPPLIMEPVFAGIGAEDDFLDEAEEENNNGGRRTLRCYYIGCSGPITDKEVTCPSPLVGEPDDPAAVFCHIRCAASYACYEVGDPFADSMMARLTERNNGVPVRLLPTPVEMLEFGMGGLTTREQAFNPTHEEVLLMGEVAAARVERNTGKARRRDPQQGQEEVD